MQTSTVVFSGANNLPDRLICVLPTKLGSSVTSLSTGQECVRSFAGFSCGGCAVLCTRDALSLRSTFNVDAC